MNKNRDELYILMRQEDQNKLIDIKNDCFSLIPLLIRKEGININFPNPLETYKNSKQHLLSCEEIIKEINQIVSKKIPKKEKVLILELLKPFLDAKISIYLYLRDCIPKYNFYNLFVDGHWKKFNSKNKLIIEIENAHKKEEGNIFYYLGQYSDI